MTQNTLSDEIERQVNEFEQFALINELYLRGVPMGKLFAQVKQSLRSIAEKTVEAVRVEKQTQPTSVTSMMIAKIHEFNQAVTEQSKKAREWLGE